MEQTTDWNVNGIFSWREFCWDSFSKKKNPYYYYYLFKFEIFFEFLSFSKEKRIVS